MWCKYLASFNLFFNQRYFWSIQYKTKQHVGILRSSWCWSTSCIYNQFWLQTTHVGALATHHPKSNKSWSSLMQHWHWYWYVGVHVLGIKFFSIRKALLIPRSFIEMIQRPWNTSGICITRIHAALQKILKQKVTLTTLNPKTRLPPMCLGKKLLGHPCQLLRCRYNQILWSWLL